MKHSYQLLVVLLLPFIFQFLTSKADDLVYETFLNCMSSRNSSDHVSSLIYNPKNSSYTSTLQAYIRNQRFNKSTTPKPIIIVTPLYESHVQSTIICSKNMGMNLRIRSGGHDFEGLSYVSYTNFVLLDMSNFRSIDVNIEEETAMVQVGAIIGELYYRIWEKSKVHAFPAGVCPTVGIGGGGASFGVILSYKLQLVRVPEMVTVFRVVKTSEENVTDIFNRWQYVAEKMDNDLFIRLNLKPDHVNKTIRASFTAFFLGDSDHLVTVMDKEFPELGVKKNDCKEMSWIKSVLFWSSDDKAPLETLLIRSPSAKFAKRKSDYLQIPIPKNGIESIMQKMLELSVVGLAINPYGGRMSEIADWETPFPHRAGNIFKIEYSVNWDEGGPDIEAYYVNQTRQFYDFMTPFVSKNPREAYLNYRDLDIGTSGVGNNSYAEGKVYGQKYFKGNFERLVKVKTMVDPGDFFTNEQSIPVLKN
ncbi:berberine/berberine-like, FAD-binding, type 2 [Artemisia annua]|uniref:Berberine/berberine-like, FAD-binding, type 2 n=1 Tax=Artemisia annua TaxID=35608 RepID=A0A2U1LP36_ARTAN|nr:berberine/berberine-like, FAD-binding, type 2 [Artemisia annua]